MLYFLVAAGENVLRALHTPIIDEVNIHQAINILENIFQKILNKK
jgi:hypothetical protein